ncbi:MAG TPA: pilus assembly protein N-terminal domain-containing protein [Gemmataceae bacterium]|nr:pilus assembly protein N-terminal domain-containing protein [Gemmataceae bacterium]
MSNRTADRDGLSRPGRSRPGPRAGAGALMLGLVVFVARAGAQPLPADGMPLPPVTGPQNIPVMAQAPGQAPELPMPQRVGDKAKAGDPLPMPMRVEPFGPGFVRLPRLDGYPEPLGTTPQPSPAVQAEYAKFVQGLKDPESTLDLILGRTRLLLLNQVQVRIQVADPRIAMGTMLAPTELSLVGKNVGTTVLTIWFVDKDNKEQILNYMVRVLPDPEFKLRLERVYKALEDEVNHAFPDSHIHIQLVGDKMVVSGQAKDIAEATQILHILRAHAPPIDTATIPTDRVYTGKPEGLGPDGLPPRGTDDFLTAGGPNVINLMKIPGEQQVMLRVTVAEVSRAAARSIGLNFSVNTKGGNLVAGNTTGNIASGGQGGLSGLNFLSPQFNFGTGGGGGGVGTGFSNIPVALDNGQVRLAINALRNLDYARSLAEPNLVTMNGQTARFQAGGRFPVPVVTGFNLTGLQGVQFIPFGVQLTFTPYITDRDRIRLNVLADVSSRDFSAGSTNIGGANIPNLITRNFLTTVELREGQTLAVAGLIQNSLGANAQRVPFFGDLPLIGRLASYDQLTSNEQELVVLVTPELVHPLEPKEVTPLPGSDLYEPTDLEFYLLGRLESHRQCDYRSPIMTDCSRLKQCRQCESMYIMGAPGHTPPPPPAHEE